WEGKGDSSGGRAWQHPGHSGRRRTGPHPRRPPRIGVGARRAERRRGPPGDETDDAPIQNEKARHLPAHVMPIPRHLPIIRHLSLRHIPRHQKSAKRKTRRKSLSTIVLEHSHRRFRALVPHLLKPQGKARSKQTCKQRRITMAGKLEGKVALVTGG